MACSTVSSDQNDNIRGELGENSLFLSTSVSFDVEFRLPWTALSSLNLDNKNHQTHHKGYGLAMIAQTAVAYKTLTASSSSSTRTPVQQLGLAASALHGLWMAAFLLARDTVLETYR